MKTPSRSAKDFEELRAANTRLQTELDAAKEATADAEKQAGVYYEQLQVAGIEPLRGHSS